MRVVILGQNGMLGNAVQKYISKFKDLDINVISKYRWPDKNFKSFISGNNFDCIINCIGAIPQRTKNFKINYTLPIWLEENTNSKIIHPGTDCEMDEDSYGISKKYASDYLLNKGNNSKIIKTSIIGHELNTCYSLLDWFLNTNENKVFGYSNVFWNGNTTLQWAKTALELINNWDAFPQRTILSTKCISKYDLLNIIKEVYGKNIIINKDHDQKSNKCLSGNRKSPNIRHQLIDLMS